MAKLYFNYSTMNAGKSTVLLQAAHNYAERGMETYLLTADFDGRAPRSLSQHDGGRRERSSRRRPRLPFTRRRAQLHPQPPPPAPPPGMAASLLNWM